MDNTNKQPLLATAALVIEDNKILLLKRGKEPYKNQWGFPGGIGGFKKTLDPSKSIIEEIRGDVGCEFNGKFFIYNYSKDNETLTLFFIGSITGNPKPVCKNVLEAKFFKFEEVRKMNLAFDHNIVLEKYLEQK